MMTRHAVLAAVLLVVGWSFACASQPGGGGLMGVRQKEEARRGSPPPAPAPPPPPAPAPAPALAALPRGRVLEGETVTLAPGYLVGQRWRYETQSAGRSTATGSAIGTMVTNIAALSRATCEVREAQGGIPATFLVTYDPATRVTTNGSDTVPSYAGQTVTFRVDAAGNVTVDAPPGVTAQDRSTLQQEGAGLLNPPMYYPPEGRAVKAGDVWDTTRGQLRSHCRLAAVRDANGRKVAEIEVNGVAAPATIAGAILVDVDSGAAAADLTTTVTTAVGDVHVDVNMRTQAHMTLVIGGR